MTEIAGRKHFYFGQTYNLLIFGGWASKIWKKLNKYTKISVNHPNVSIFWGCVHLHKTDNELFNFSMIKF